MNIQPLSAPTRRAPLTASGACATSPASSLNNSGRLTLAALVAGACLLTVSSASAALVQFSGVDLTPLSTSPRPNANAAAAAFQAATFSLSTITFEGLNLSVDAPFSLPIDLGGGVTLTSTGDTQGISNSTTTTTGYNTTSGGSLFYQYTTNTSANNATFSFATPINAFGAYFTGVGYMVLGRVHILFSDGTNQDLTVEEPTSSGGSVTFLGFTDDGKSISSVQISIFAENGQINDVFGIDDVQYGNTSAIPEPTTALFGLALVGACAAARRRVKTTA